MKTMDDLRSVIFDTIDDVRKGKLDAATAKAISELSQNVINSAKAEADYARATGQVVRSGLISTEQAAPPLAAPAADALPAATTSVTRTHTDRGTVIEREGNRTRHILK
jgi:hypothetical protein